MNKHSLAIGTLVVVATALVTWAAVAYTPLTREEMSGRWEALVPDEPRVFLLDIVDGKNAVVTMAAGVPPSPDVSKFIAKSVVIEDGGLVYMEARGAAGMVLKIRGRGRGRRTAARIVADIELWGPKKEFGPTLFSATFESRGTPDYFEILSTLIKKAEE